jgi:hypothetical protein
VLWLMWRRMVSKKFAAPAAAQGAAAAAWRAFSAVKANDDERINVQRPVLKIRRISWVNGAEPPECGKPFGFTSESVSLRLLVFPCVPAVQAHHSL